MSGELLPNRSFIDLHSWLHVIKNGEKKLLPQIEALEPGNNLTDKVKTELLDSVHTMLCVGQDLNLRSPKGDRFTVYCD